MSTITREWLQQAINDYESVRDELPFGLDDYQGNILAALRIALASLEAEPIGAFHIAEQQVDGTSDYIKDGEWPIDNGIIEVYAAPPVPVVPAALPENDDEDGHDIDYLEPSEVYALGRTAGWNACRAAMLQGKSEQPQNAQQNIPENIPGGNSPVTPDGWISCSDRMPNEEDVLVYCSDTKEQMVGFHKGKGLFQFFYMNGVEGVCEPSHWMPLPEPPL
ncbi:DUF551 domain-containing protein [Shigella flexneri]|uniref:DUF551 domain-containing protein n=1 Tax=Enterobacteriaceae TaxID=543 RepID=UPI000FAD7C20|nr:MULTISPECIES: DUF551 domain-containing protein [Enterobacteriaceae]EIK8829947.1 DUF551 domain-containing protein [Shigella sonnei]HAY5688121.1 DUF551 domain-containing protein [Shigella flexneri 2b]HAY6291378.1 DUF551 domain-containing protein [Shigella flexneri 4c]EAA0661164.1 DUF551 domain-containing protein [Shigella flexneri]EFA7715877.1 DUF551 domain-containing protein [Escherichia coli]